MHKRLTRQRVERWNKQAHTLAGGVEAMVREVSAYRVDSKGGNHADLLKIQVELTEAADRLHKSWAHGADFKERRWPNQ